MTSISDKITGAMLYWVPECKNASANTKIKVNVLQDLAKIDKIIYVMDIKVYSLASVFWTGLAASQAILAPISYLVLSRMNYGYVAIITPVVNLAIAYAFQSISHSYKDTAWAPYALTFFDDSHLANLSKG